MKQLDALSRRQLCAAAAPGMLAAGLAGGVAMDARAQDTVSAMQPTVKDFGARGDGETDDTEAFQRAVDAGEGGFFVPHGVYRLTRPVVAELDQTGFFGMSGDGTASIHMAGPGPAFKLIGTHTGTASPDSFEERVWLRQRTPTVSGLEILGKHPEAEGIRVEQCMQATFHRVVVREALHGIHLAVRNRNVIVSDCHLYKNNGIGLFLDNVNLHQINVVGSHISYNGGGGIVLRGSTVRNLQIGTCDIESNMDPDGPPTANVLFDTTGGSVDEGAIVGCTIQHNHNAPGSANIRMLGAGSLEQSGQPVGNFIISGNAISDVFTNIHLQHAQAVVIQGNTFWKGFAHNLLIERSSNIVIGPNSLDQMEAYRPNDSPNGVVMEDCVDSQITGLHLARTLTPEAAMVLRRCKRINMTGCSILDCDGCGLLLEDVELVRVSDCIIRDDRPAREEAVAIRLTKGRNNMIVNNLYGGNVEIAPDSGAFRGNYRGNTA